MLLDPMAENIRERGRRRSSPELCSRGGAAPEKTELGLPGTDSSGAGVWKYLHGTREAPGHSAGLGKACGGAFDGRAEVARRTPPACGLRAVLGSDLGAKKVLTRMQS